MKLHRCRRPREHRFKCSYAGSIPSASSEYAPIDRWATPEEFDQWKAEALSLGIEVVESGPLVRSSIMLKNSLHNSRHSTKHPPNSTHSVSNR